MDDLEPGQASVPPQVDRLDLRGLKCPLPALRTRKALAKLLPGRVLEVRCSDPLAIVDIPNLLRESGDVLLGVEAAATETSFSIRKA